MKKLIPLPRSKVIGSTMPQGGSLFPTSGNASKRGLQGTFCPRSSCADDSSLRPKNISYNKNSHPDSIAIKGFHTKGNNQKIKLRFWVAEISAVRCFIFFKLQVDARWLQDAIKTKQASLLNVTCCFSQVGFLDLDGDSACLKVGESALVYSKWKWTQ